MLKIGNRGIVMMEAIITVMILMILSLTVFRLSLSRRTAVRNIEHRSEWGERSKVLIEELKGSSLRTLIRQIEDGRSMINIGDMEFSCSSDSANGVQMKLLLDKEQSETQSTRLYAEIKPECDGTIRCPVLPHPGNRTNFVISPDMISDAYRAIQDDIELFLDDDAEWMEDVRSDTELLEEAEESGDDLILDEAENEDSISQKNLYIHIEEMENEKRLKIRVWLEVNTEEDGAWISVEKELLNCERDLIESSAYNGELLNKVYLYLPSLEEVTLGHIVFTGNLDQVCHCYVIEEEENDCRYQQEDLLSAEEWAEIHTNIQKRYNETEMEERTLSQLYSIHIWVKDAEDLRYGEDGHAGEICDYFSTKLETYQE